MIGRAGLVLAALVGAGFTVVRDPDATLQPIRWPTANITVLINQAGAADVTDDSDLAAIRLAMAAWTAVDCSALTFVDGGTTASVTTGNDGTNLIAFLESGWPGAADGAVAYTQMVTNSTPVPDVWLDADVLLNGVEFTWSTSGNPRAYDVQSSVTHELGHVLGLRHDATPEATMYFASRRGRTFQRTLHEDDRAGVCFLYPVASASCTDDGDCPMYSAANGGSATRARCASGSGGGTSCAAGGATYGEDCLSDADCASGPCARLDDTPTSDSGFCTMPCPQEGCPAGSRCDTFAGGQHCAPGYDDCLDAADCATTNVVCEQDLDGRFHCMRLCLSDANCVSGGICHGGTGAQPASYCRQPGAATEGAPCGDAFDCASLLCGTDTGGVGHCVGDAVAPGDDGGPSDDGGPTGDGGPTDGAPSDGGPGDDGGPMGDSGPGDGGPGADGGGDADGGGWAADGGTDDADPDDADVLQDRRVAGGGCTAAAPGALGLLVALMLVRRPGRRRPPTG